MKKLAKYILIISLSLIVLLLSVYFVKLQKENNTLRGLVQIKNLSQKSNIDLQSKSASSNETDTSDIGLSIGESRDLEIAPSIAANYLMWEKLYGVDIPENTSTYSEDNKDGTSTLYLDDLMIIYDRNNFSAKSATIVYLPNQLEESEEIGRIFKLISFFAAFECGKPQEDSLEEAKDIMHEMYVLYDALLNSMNERLLDLDEYVFVPFYDGAAGKYYYFVTEKNDLVVAMIVNGM